MEEIGSNLFTLLVVAFMIFRFVSAAKKKGQAESSAKNPVNGKAAMAGKPVAAGSSLGNKRTKARPVSAAVKPSTHAATHAAGHVAAHAPAYTPVHIPAHTAAHPVASISISPPGIHDKRQVVAVESVNQARLSSRRIDALPPLQQAVVMAELLGQPKGLREEG